MEENKIIYLDNAATTCPLNDVVECFTATLKSNWENASSSHYRGVDANHLYEKTKEVILKDLHISNYNVIFTSGASEANNLALKGFVEKHANRGKHIIISAIEHSSIMNTANHLQTLGYKVSICPVRNDGKVHVEDLEPLIQNDTILVSIMAVNNETGIIQDSVSIAAMLKKYPKIVFHVDAVQGMGKVDLPLQNFDMITISLHKLGGLKSSGILLVRKGIELTSQTDGGGQQDGFRSGTTDVAMAVAASKTISHLKEYKASFNHVYQMAEKIYNYLESKSELFKINSTLENPYIVNFSLETKKASVVVEDLSMHNIMVGSHSACSSKLDKGSPCLIAMGDSELEAKNSIRISFSRFNTLEEVDTFIKVLDEVMERTRG